jgi:hypothetical protein
MTVQITIQDTKKAVALLQFLTAFEMIDSFNIVFDDALPNESISAEEAAFFDTFYNNTPELSMSKLTLA